MTMIIKLNGYADMKKHMKAGIDEALMVIEREFGFTISYDEPTAAEIKAKGILFFHSMFIESLIDKGTRTRPDEFERAYYHFFEDYIREAKIDISKDDHRQDQFSKRYSDTAWETRQKDKQ